MLLLPTLRTIKSISPMGMGILGNFAPKSYSAKANNPNNPINPINADNPINATNANNPCSKHNNPCSSETIRRMKCEFKKIRKVELPPLGGCGTCPKLGGDACEPPKSNKQKPKESMWYNPKCCIEPCPGMVERYDQLYYKPQGLSRRFVRTWVECPHFHVAPRKVCCFENVQLPPIERRPRKPKSDKIFTAMDKLLMMCRMKSNDKCYKMQMAYCRPVRNPPKCFVIRRPSNCTKPTAPYPSYSECDKPRPKPLRATECACLVVNSHCEFV